MKPERAPKKEIQMAKKTLRVFNIIIPQENAN